MAGGGIVAFADEGLVQDKNSDEYLKSVNNQVLAKGLQDYLSGANKATEAIKPDIEAEKASIQADKDRQLGMALLEGGFRGLQNLSPYAAVGLGRLGEGVVGSYAKQGKDISGAEQELRKEKIEAQKADEARQADIFGKAMGVQATIGSKEASLENARALKQMQIDQNKSALLEKANVDFAARVKDEEAVLAKAYNIDLMSGKMTMPQISAMARSNVINRMDPNYLKSYNLGTPETKATQYPMVTANPVVGTIYQTARGPAKWDGKQFISVQ